MPKLSATQLQARLSERLAKLKAGEKVAAKDVRVLLNKEQLDEMDAAWQVQQELRNQKRARSKEEEIELGWKSKRNVQIEAYEKALSKANTGMHQSLQDEMQATEIRSTRVELDAYFGALAEGKNTFQAESAGRIARQRAGLLKSTSIGIEQRNKEVWAMEAAIIQAGIDKMTPEEREQYELLQEVEKAEAEMLKKRQKR